ncbi:type VI secretion system Vgr family protein [Sorangium sp. So ce861]|uniref:type VI secretion system Vgr family protein n=1 Tax=Sorangium sp. So ce861 TaxID=3133323 RepID=UPI003F60BEE1
MKDLYTIQSSVLPEDSRVVAFRGHEAVSRPYHFDIYFTTASEGSQDFEMADAIGAKATLTMERDDGGDPFRFHGVLSTLELVREFEGRALFHATLVPLLWQLTLSQHSRIFTGLSIPDIIKAVLEDAGLSPDSFELRLFGSYKPEEHVCQYRESDFDFISRWMEREGLYYFFEHRDGPEKLIITDHRSFHEDIVASHVRYYPTASADHISGAALRSFMCRHHSVPAAVRLKDYDYLRPNLDVSGAAPVSLTGLGEISVYGARFFSPEQGKRLAELRAEELLARQVLYLGDGNAPHFRSGYAFTLEDHPRGSFNARYLITAVVHWGKNAGRSSEVERLLGIETDDVYRMEVTAIPASVQFRAESRTQWPRIYGYENGTVDGAQDSEYAQVDDHGRYAVKFHFDESPLKDGQASTWVRMAQPHGGGVEGWHFPLRKGVEVLLTFFGGDPDRPVIAAVVPNALNPSPITSANNTANIIQTGGRNRIEMEDRVGSQRVTISTPTKNTFIRMGAPNDDSNLYLNTEGWTYFYIGEDYTQRTAGRKWEYVEKEITEDYKGPFTTVVTNLVEEKYKDKHKTTISKGREETVVDGGHKLTVTAGGHTLTVDAGGSNVTIKGGTTHTIVDGGLHENITGASERKIHGTLLDEVDSALTQNYKGGVTQTVTGGGLTQTIPTGQWNVTANGISHTNTAQWQDLTLGDHIKFTANMTSETLLGLKNENVIGMKIETLLGGKIELSFSTRIGVHGGIFSDQSPVNLENWGLALRNTGTAIKNAAVAGLEAYGAHMSAAGLHGMM